MKIYLRYCLLLLTLFSCEEREWDNPFDPECPKDLFTPSDFTATLIGNSIQLSWKQTNMHISGFRITKKTGANPETVLPMPGKGVLQLTDSDIIPGQLCTYTLVAIAGDNQSNQVQAQITPVVLSSVTTNGISGLRVNSAICDGNISNSGGASITARGVCWSTTANPTVNNFKTNDGSGTGNFTSTITGLAANTTYYLRAYSTNSAGTSYGNQITFKTFFGEVSDTDGNVYLTVKIGEQVWMAENLKTTKYNDGTSIPNVTNNAAWVGLTTGAYCWYNNDVNNKNIYGALYNWYAVSTNKLAPEGWHIATDSDWSTLSNYLGGNVLSGGKLKEIGTTHWLSPNNGATNESGFSALPGGYRYDGGSFTLITAGGYWWSSTVSSVTTAQSLGLGYDSSDLHRGSGYKYGGFSVRCILGNLSTPTITTADISNKTETSATTGGNITSDGGSPVTARGVCWSTSQNPTTAISKTTNGTGTGSFSSNITGLTANTTYYVRAYATNSVGTSYGNQVSFTASQSASQTVTDVEGNIYNTVTIGTQVWMVENLKTTKYNDGTAIPNITDNSTWAALTTGAYCWNNNDINFKVIYGALYNWFAVNTGKLCPASWHIPTDSEWTTLINYLGGESLAGGKLKEAGIAHWQNPNKGATNETGFTALPGGSRYYAGAFSFSGSGGCWWSSTAYSSVYAFYLTLNSDFTSADFLFQSKYYGFSIRCIKD